MIIRSQDKKVIINLDNVCQVRTGGISDSRIIVFADDMVVVLGEYSEGKAIKVLDMIQNKYFEHIGTVDGNGTTMMIMERPKVFQMPQDSEVQDA